MNLEDIIVKNVGSQGKMIAMSKSIYRDAHPNNLVYFNACIFDSKARQIYWGDIDVTLEKRKIQKVANISNRILYLTPENPFRSDFNKVNKKQLEQDEHVIKIVPKK